MILGSGFFPSNFAKLQINILKASFNPLYMHQKNFSFLTLGKQNLEDLSISSYEPVINSEMQ